MTSNRSYQTTDELLAEGIEVAERQIWEFDEPGEAIGKGRDIEDYCVDSQAEDEEEIDRRLREHRKTPAEKARDEHHRKLEKCRYLYIYQGEENDIYTPSAEDRLEREEVLHGIANATLIPF